MNAANTELLVDRLRRELDASERRLRSIITRNPDAILVLDREGIIVFANPAAEALLAAPPGGLVGQAFGFPTLAGETTEIEIGAHGRYGRQVEMRVGETEWDGAPAIMASLRDITDRKRAERALRRSEARYRQAFDQALTGNSISTADGLLIACNPSFLRIFGFETLAQAKAHGLARLYRNTEERRKVLDTLARRQVVRPHEIEMRRADGTPVHVIENLFGTFDAAGRLQTLTSYMLDITERRNLEAQLLQAQKMEAIGRLAGGLAHDFNNLLTVVTGYGALLLKRLPPGDHLRDSAHEIVDAADRAAALTSRLLTFSRRQFTQSTLFRLGDLLENVAPLLRSAAGDDIRLRMHIHPEAGVIRADKSQMEQVIMNLVVNARDAMPEGGTMTIRVEPVSYADAAENRPVGIASGRYVMFSVTDTGHGMTAEVRSRLFEPFFTTKPQGKGTGLGLSIVYGIVKRAGGEILVESEPGQGSAFRIFFPAVDEVPEYREPAEFADPPARGTETILLIDDDPSLRKLAAAVLCEAGYRVLETADPRHALRISSETPIDLLITDVLMPEMNGRNLAEKVVQACPQTRILYISGFNEDTILSQGVYEAGTYFLRKPFTPGELERNVRDILDQPLHRPFAKAHRA